MGLLNWLKSIFSSDDDFSPRVKKESKKVNDTSDKSEYDQKINKDMVFSNKELRDLLILFEANENTIDSFDVQIQLKHNVTHETGLEFGHDLEYKGFKYKLLGVIDEEEADAFFDEKINSLEGFLEIIGEKEISHLDDSINILCEKMYTGYINEVKWLDNTPIEIIEEFKNKYSADNYHVLADKHERDGNLEYYGQSEFKEEYNNIQNITLNFKIKEKYHDKRFSPFYEIDWINDVKTFSNNIKESKKVDDTSENKNSEPEVIDKDTIVSKIGPFNTKIKLEFLVKILSELINHELNLNEIIQQISEANGDLVEFEDPFEGGESFIFDSYIDGIVLDANNNFGYEYLIQILEKVFKEEFYYMRSDEFYWNAEVEDPDLKIFIKKEFVNSNIESNDKTILIVTTKDHESHNVGKINEKNFLTNDEKILNDSLSENNKAEKSYHGHYTYYYIRKKDFNIEKWWLGWTSEID